jgi:hypothetical protein
MSSWLTNLQNALHANQKESRRWTVGGKSGGAALLISPFGARLLGCTLPGVEGNLFWHPPEMEDPAKAGDLFRRGAGAPGGDRFWVAPEVAYMWPDLKAARKQPFGDNYQLPAAMDPGDWRIAEDSSGHLRLTAEMKLTDHRVKKSITLRAHRQIDLIDHPAPGVSPELFPGLSRRIVSLSFAIRNELTVLEADPGAVAGGWELLQVPTTGTLICPTVGPASLPRSYYRPFGKKHIRCDKRAIRFLIDASRQVKMGLSATETTGRMGYLRRVGKVDTLIVRCFAPLPGEPYLDLPRASNEFFGGDCLQAYNDGAGPHSFGEMEYHDPALIAGKEPSTRVGTSVTHILAGPPKAIRAAGEMLLGVKI